MGETSMIWAELELAPLTRADVALFAGGSGDHNPVHIDLDAARSMGFDDVFAQGMLSMALLGRLLTSKAGPRALRSFGARFEAPYRIGDVLLMRALVAERFVQSGENCVRLMLSGMARDVMILSGEAVLAEGEME